MKERGILFSAPMVRAILAGRKTQTRRVVKPQPDTVFFPGCVTRMDLECGWEPLWPTKTAGKMNSITCPHGAPGDRLWVRETFVLEWPEMDRPEDEEEFRRWVVPHYAATEPKPDLVDSVTEKPLGWRPSIFMPRWASRITLEVTEVRVERLQDISEEDARAEGAEADDISRVGVPAFSARQRLSQLWDSINGPGSWESNPWVWCISFKRVDAKERAA